MRYLRVTAQDHSDNGKADTVLMYFYQEVEGEEDRLVYKAAAVDMTADGQVNVQFAGDINNDGQNNAQDKALIKQFADTFLKLNWFNRGDNWERYLKIFSQDYYRDKKADTVRLHFHEGTGTPRDQTIAYTASAYDLSQDGKINYTINFDVDNDGIVNRSDRELVKLMSETFMQFNWYGR